MAFLCQRKSGYFKRQNCWWAACHSTDCHLLRLIKRVSVRLCPLCYLLLWIIGAKSCCVAVLNRMMFDLW